MYTNDSNDVTIIVVYAVIISLEHLRYLTSFLCCPCSGSLTAQLPNPIAGLPNPPAGLPNPAAGQQVVQKVVSAVTAGISGVVNSISNNGENQPPLPGPGGLPALPGQQGTVLGVPPPPENVTMAAMADSGTSKTGRLVGGAPPCLACVFFWGKWGACAVCEIVMFAAFWVTTKLQIRVWWILYEA